MQKPRYGVGEVLWVKSTRRHGDVLERFYLAQDEDYAIRIEEWLPAYQPLFSLTSRKSLDAPFTAGAAVADRWYAPNGVARRARHSPDLNRRSVFSAIISIVHADRGEITRICVVFEFSDQVEEAFPQIVLHRAGYV